MSASKVSSKVIAEISNTILRDNYLWIACQSDRLPIKTDPNLKGKNFILSDFLQFFSKDDY
jgi:hypothetical protein